ncbi:MAG: autotransporter outer membrane beta-barrel domain-containing protein, partial [Planctomycetes bacterium]|nr:autotransporter outer membrane beta-barrel domain-containing protein [Planctomycetota bacterium]
NNNQTLAGKKGATLDYVFRLEQKDNYLYAVVDSVQAAPEAKVLSEGFITGAAVLNQTGDLVAGEGMANARQAAGISGAGFGSFGAVSGGRSRYNTGSHVDVSGLSLIAGFSWGRDAAPGRLTLGAFFDYGTGSYDTYNSFGNVDANGSGNMYHLGGGVLGRVDFLDSGPGNFHAEASFRAGGVHNDYRASSLLDSLGGAAGGYDAFSAYYSLHAGLGYIWKLTERASLDLYGKYFWTRQNGDSITLSTGDPVRFEATNSHRLRLGGRWSYAVNKCVSPYIGAAWEYEFSGRQRADSYGYALDTPSLRGGTGIGELGLSLTPSQDLPLSIDLGVQGYVGKREGLTGSLQAIWRF